MRRGTQQFMDGIGILGYDNVDAVASELDRIDRIRFQYPWASDPAQRCMFGSMPSMTQIQDIVEFARKYDRGAGVSEDQWNSEVQNPLLKLAHSTSKHWRTLHICNV
jgi:hypothetical protein